MIPSAVQPDVFLAELLALPAPQRCARLRDVAAASEDASALLMRLGDEAERLAHVEVSRALAATEAVVLLADELGAARPRVRARRARGQALAFAGQHAESLHVCQAAVALGEQCRESVEAARARLASIHPLSELGRYDEAIAAGEAAYAVFAAERAGDLQARADINLGAVHQNRDDPQRALFHLDRAAARLGPSGGMLHFSIENNRGEALWRLCRFGEAELAFRAALAVATDADAGVARGLAEGNLAELDARRGYLSRALFHFEHARRRFEQDAADSHAARVIAEQAEVLEALGLHHSAIDVFDDALRRLDHRGQSAEAARARLCLGRCLLHVGRIEEAGAALDAAAAEFARLGQPRAQALVDLVQVERLLHDGQLLEADALAERCETALSDRPVDAIRATLARTRVTLAGGRLLDVEPLLARARARLNATPVVPLQAELHRVTGQLHERRGAPGDAAREYLAAVALVEQTRGMLQATRLRSAFLGQHLAAYEDALAAMLRSPEEFAPPAIFETIELAKGRSLLEDGEAEAPAADADDTQAALLRAELNAIYQQLTEAGQVPSGGNWLAEIRRRERALAALEDRAASATGPRASLPVRPAPVAQVCAALADDEALLEYAPVRDQMMACVLRRDGLSLHARLAPVAEVEELLRRLRFQINRAARPGADAGPRAARLTADVNAVLHELWLVLIAPLRRALGQARRLRVVPSGALHGLPIHALYDGEQHLIETLEISYAPSASVYARLAAAPVRPPASSLVLSVEDERAPQIALEARGVARMLPNCTLLEGADANAAGLRQRASTADVLHLACHGRFARAMPDAAGLKLSDGWFHVRNIAALRPLSAQLVALSACDTGASVTRHGDELFGLQRAFLGAGAQSLLLSLWQLHDDAACDTMAHFYQTWLKSPIAGHRSAALRAAQMHTMKMRPHVLFWAPLILVGQP